VSLNQLCVKEEPIICVLTDDWTHNGKGKWNDGIDSSFP
jgi:hypothetical protein